MQVESGGLQVSRRRAPSPGPSSAAEGPWELPSVTSAGLRHDGHCLEESESQTDGGSSSQGARVNWTYPALVPYLKEHLTLDVWTEDCNDDGWMLTPGERKVQQGARGDMDDEGNPSSMPALLEAHEEDSEDEDSVENEGSL